MYHGKFSCVMKTFLHHGNFLCIMENFMNQQKMQDSWKMFMYKVIRIENCQEFIGKCQ